MGQFLGHWRGLPQLPSQVRTQSFFIKFFAHEIGNNDLNWRTERPRPRPFELNFFSVFKSTQYASFGTQQRYLIDIRKQFFIFWSGYGHGRGPWPYGLTQIFPAQLFFVDSWVRYQVMPSEKPQDLIIVQI